MRGLIVVRLGLPASCYSTPGKRICEFSSGGFLLAISFTDRLLGWAKRGGLRGSRYLKRVANSQFLG